MSIEYEINYYFVDANEIRQTLKQIGAEQTSPQLTHTRYIYVIPDSLSDQTIDTFLTESKPYLQSEKIDDIRTLIPYGDYLRIRDEGEYTTLSIKVHADKDGQMSDQQEAESIVSDISHVQMILDRYGFHIKNTQENMREVWDLSETCTLMIDWWPFLRPYVELESSSEEEVTQWADKLGLIEKERQGEVRSTVASVSDIYADTYDISPETMLQESRLTFHQRPEWIPPHIPAYR